MSKEIETTVEKADLLYAFHTLINSGKLTQAEAEKLILARKQRLFELESERERLLDPYLIEEYMEKGSFQAPAKPSEKRDCVRRDGTPFTMQMHMTYPKTPTLPKVTTWTYNPDGRGDLLHHSRPKTPRNTINRFNAHLCAIPQKSRQMFQEIARSKGYEEGIVAVQEFKRNGNGKQLPLPHINKATDRVHAMPLAQLHGKYAGWLNGLRGTKRYGEIRRLAKKEGVAAAVARMAELRK